MKKILHDILYIRSMNKTICGLENVSKDFIHFDNVLDVLDTKASIGYRNVLELRIDLHKSLKKLCLLSERILVKEFIFKQVFYKLGYNYLYAISKMEKPNINQHLLLNETSNYIYPENNIILDLYTRANDIIEIGNLSDLIYINNCCKTFALELIILLKDEQRKHIY